MPDGSSKMVRCRNCGVEIAVDAKFCSACGARREETVELPSLREMPSAVVPVPPRPGFFGRREILELLPEITRSMLQGRGQ